MSGKVISIEIGIHTTKICEVDYKKKNPRVYNCIIFDTPKNAYEDGYIRDKNKFVEIAKEKIRNAALKGNKVVFTISSSKIANREVIIPFVKENRIQDIVNANATEYFPVDITDYVITYNVLETIQAEGIKKLRLLVLAAPETLIKNYYNIADLLGLEVVSIDYNGNSSYQIVKSQFPNGTNLLIQLNDSNTLIHIIEDGVLSLQRSVEFGSLSVVKTLLEYEYIATNEQDGIKLLKKEQFIQGSDIADAFQEAAVTIALTDQEQRNFTKKIHVKNEITDSLKYLIGNILRVLDYYYSKNKDKKIQTIYITGLGASFKGFDELLVTETGIAVKKMDTLQAVNFKKNISLEAIDPSDFISCIGAAVNPVNFIPKDYLLRVKKQSNNQYLKIIFGGAVVISIILVTSSYIALKSASIDNKRLNQEIDNLSEINEIFEANAKASVMYQQASAMISSTVNPNIWLNDVISQLENKLPQNTVIETFQVTSTDINLSLKCNSKEVAAKTLMELKEIPYLTNINTGGMTETEDENGLSTVRFIITGDYNLALLQEDNHEDNN